MATKKKKYQEGSTVTQGAAPTLEQRHDPILGKVETQSGIDPTQATTSLPSGTEMIHTPQAIQTNELMTSTGKLVGTSTPVTAAQGTTPTQITSPTAPTPGTYAATAVYNQVTDANAALGALSQNAQINSPQGTVSSQALSQAATGQATQATTPVRTLSTQELVESATLSDIGGYQSASEQTMSTPQEATVQYQLTQLMSQFDNNQIPAFAAPAIKVANDAMLQRGLGASSMAGQAILKAAMEATTAIAVQDANMYAQFNMANLSNKQQTAIVNAQLRATLTGQELTNEQQSRVLNTAKVSEVNNLNFTAEQTVALENARLMQNMSLANLNNAQQSALQNAATLANMDVRNLDARLTAAVQNAKSFLDLDMANLTNDQQAKTLTYQSKIQSLLSDTAGQNAASQFNAKAQDQVDQFYKTLSTSIQTANANRVSAQEQFNVDQANSVRKFNTEMENERDKFDSEMNLLIDQSNVVWRRGINTTTNAEQNRVNQVNAQNLLDLTTSAQNQLWNRYRDEAGWLLQLQESREARAHQAALQAQQNNFSWDTYEKQSKDSMWLAIGGAIIDGIFG
tara:strand:- start:144 stop:1853 length:1710 start_codon:yes stop_codon:yes gene_type:complete